MIMEAALALLGLFGAAIAWFATRIDQRNRRKLLEQDLGLLRQALELRSERGADEPEQTARMEPPRSEVGTEAVAGIEYQQFVQDLVHLVHREARLLSVRAEASRRQQWSRVLIILGATGVTISLTLMGITIWVLNTAVQNKITVDFGENLIWAQFGLELFAEVVSGALIVFTIMTMVGACLQFFDNGKNTSFPGRPANA